MDDPRIPVRQEVDRVLDKFQKYENFSDENISKIEAKLQELNYQLEEVISKDPSNDGEDGPALTSEQVSNLVAAMAEIKEMNQNTITKHRELHAIVSKVGKACDKNFENSYEFLQTKTPFLREESRPKLYEVICNHLCREGLQDTAEQLIKDSNLEITSELTQTFHEMNKIVTQLREHNLEPAMEWAEAHKQQLKERKSSLEFKLHRMAFIMMVASSNQDVSAAIEYARKHLKPYIETHQTAIQNAVGALVFMRTGLEGTPYKKLLHQSQWDDIIETFTKDASLVIGLSLHSPLAVCINAGCIALPVLLNIKQVLSGAQVQTMWSGKEELPIEINVGQDAANYHSIFACPILRQQSTESNPPMRLSCGHVISKDALTRLSQTSKSSAARRGSAGSGAVKVKCPYCPMEQNITDPKQIVF